MDEEFIEVTTQRKEVLDKLINCLKEDLNIAFPVEVIHPDAPLFGSGLGLDSIDSLEVIMTVENEFGVALDESDIQSLRTLNILTDSILTQKGNHKGEYR